DRARGPEPLVRRGTGRAGARRAGAGRARPRADSRGGTIRSVRRASRLHAGDRQRSGPSQPAHGQHGGRRQRGCARAMKTRGASTALWAALLLLPANATHAAKQDKQDKREKKDKKEKPGRVPAAATHELAGNCSDSDTAALWWAPLGSVVGHPVKI